MVYISKEFKDQLTGELTNPVDYRRMKEALRDRPKETTVTNNKDSQEWKTWILSPVWSAPDATASEPAHNSIQADSVQCAPDRMDKNPL